MDKKIKKHLLSDIKTFKKEAADDKELIKSMAKHEKSEKMKKAGKKGARRIKKEVKEGKKEMKVEKVMREFKEKKLHSGSKKGPKVRSRKQAIAIALSEGRKAAKKKKSY